MPCRMINLDFSWLKNAEAAYVLVAYGVALGALGGLLVATICAARKTAAEWARLQDQRRRDAQP